MRFQGLELVSKAAELNFHVTVGDGFPTAAPPVAEQWVHLGGDLIDLEGAAGRDECDGSFGGSFGGYGGELVGAEPGSETTYRLVLVARRLGGSQHPVREAHQADVPQQVVQDRQGKQVLFDRGETTQRVPARALLLHGADNDAREPTTRSELDPVDRQVQQDANAPGDGTDRVADSLGGGVLVERSQVLPDPGAH